MSNPLEPARRLAARLREVAAEIGLELQDFSITPSEDGDQATAMFSTVPQQSRPARGEDPEFEAIMQAERQREIDARTQAEREALTELRDSLTDKRKGIGLDEDLHHATPPDPGE